MRNWRDFMTPLEKLELADIAEAKREGQTQYRRIYDRCRKRMAKSAQEAL